MRGFPPRRPSRPTSGSAGLLALGLLLRSASAGVAPGLRLLGGAQQGEAPVLAFGPAGSDEVILTAATSSQGGASLELRRGSLRQASFGADAAILTNTVVDAELAATSLRMGGVLQWALWDLDTFDAVEASPWSLNDRGFCGSMYDQFLGGHCRLGASATTRRYEALPSHTRVRVRARIHYIDDWNGESVMMQVDNKTVWAQSHEWCPGFQKWMCSKFGVDSCGRGTPDRLSVKAEATLAHSAATLDIGFASSLAAGSDACHASWGVDDVSLELL